MRLKAKVTFGFKEKYPAASKQAKSTPRRARIFYPAASNNLLPWSISWFFLLLILFGRGNQNKVCFNSELNRFDSNLTRFTENGRIYEWSRDHLLLQKKSAWVQMTSPFVPLPLCPFLPYPDRLKLVQCRVQRHNPGPDSQVSNDSMVILTL